MSHKPRNSGQSLCEADEAGNRCFPRASAGEGPADTIVSYSGLKAEREKTSVVSSYPVVVNYYGSHGK